MARTLWEVFNSLFKRNSKGAEEDENEEGTFIPSPLDLSVRVSHGGSDEEIERELHKIHEQARELEDEQRDR